MARYIDADLLEKELDKNGLSTGAILGRHDGKCDLAEYIVNKQPTADVEKVVHCKDCKYSYNTKGFIVLGCNRWNVVGMTEDFYCADGKLKEVQNG